MTDMYSYEEQHLASESLLNEPPGIREGAGGGCNALSSQPEVCCKLPGRGHFPSSVFFKDRQGN